MNKAKKKVKIKGRVNRKSYTDAPLTKIGSVKVRVPTKIEHITLGQYQDYLATPLVDSNTYKMVIVSIFCNTPIDLVLEHCTVPQIEQAYTTIIGTVKRLESKESYKKFTPTFKIGNVVMGFEPDFENIKAGAFADLTAYFGEWKTMHNAMAILFRPIAKSKRNRLLKIVQYELVPYTSTAFYAPLMRNMPASIAMHANFFLESSFLDLRILFLTYIQELLNRIPELNTPQNRHLLTTGDGISLSTLLQEITFWTSKGRQN